MGVFTVDYFRWENISNYVTVCSHYVLRNSSIHDNIPDVCLEVKCLVAGILTLLLDTS